MSVLRALFSVMMIALRRLSTSIVLNICFLARFLTSRFAEAFQGPMGRFKRASGSLPLPLFPEPLGLQDVQVAR